MAEGRSLSDLLWDYGFYAPIGFAVSIVEEIPRLTDKGKERTAGQLDVARMIGKLAVGQGRREMGKLFSGDFRAAATPNARSGSADANHKGSAHSRNGSAAPTATTVAPSSSGPSSSGPSSSGPASSGPASLAIPGYDTLAASQVVQRLSSLSRDELGAIGRYELSTRGRRTILHRIAQLTTDG